MLITEQELFTHAPGGVLSPDGIAGLRLRTHQLHTHATLTREQWNEIDTLLVTVAPQYMGAVMDLTDRGLTQRIGSIGVSTSQYRSVGRMDAASRNMYAAAAGVNQRLSVTPHTVPLIFSYADYQFDVTEMEAAQRLGHNLDTTHAEEAMRTVLEDFEDLLVNGSTADSIGGQVLYGYRTHPQRATGSAAGVWSTAANIFSTVTAMFAVMIARRRMGPFAFYTSATQWGEMHAESGVDRSYTVLRKLQESFPTIVSWRPLFSLPDGELLLVELQRRTVDVAIKLDPSNIPWEIMGGLAQHVRVLGSVVPRVKVDENGENGVVHFSGA